MTIGRKRPLHAAGREPLVAWPTQVVNDNGRYLQRPRGVALELPKPEDHLSARSTSVQTMGAEKRLIGWESVPATPFKTVAAQSGANWR